MIKLTGYAWQEIIMLNGPLDSNSPANIVIIIYMVVLAALVVLVFHQKIRAGRCNKRLSTLELDIEKYRILFNGSSDAHLLLLDHLIVDCNKATELMWGLDKSDILGRNPGVFSPALQPDGEDSIEKASRIIDEALASGGGTNEWLHVRNDGTSFWIEIVFNPVQYLGRKALLATVRDISLRKHVEDELRKSKDRARILLDQTMLAVIEWDLQFRVREWNPAAEKIFGYTRNDAIGRTAAEFIVPAEALPSVDAVWKELLEQRGGQHSLNSNITRDGRTIVCEWYNTPLVDNQGRTIGVASMVNDVSERERIEADLIESREKLEAVVAAAQDGVVLIDSKGTVTLWNEAASRIFGYSIDEVMGQNLYQLATPPRLLAYYEKWMSGFGMKGDGPYAGLTREIMVMRKGGDEFPIELSLSSMVIGGKQCALGIVRDITKRRQSDYEIREANRQLKELTEALSFQACHDPLTGVFNRRAVFEMFEKEYSRMSRDRKGFCIGLFDLDKFKEVNDAYGHQTGDDVLCGFVDRIRSRLREYDHLGRYGGEEFMVITPGCTRREAEDIYSRLCQLVSETPIVTRSGSLSISVSVGVAEADASRTIDSLLAKADRALYRAKSAGRNMVEFAWKEWNEENDIS